MKKSPTKPKDEQLDKKTIESLKHQLARAVADYQNLEKRSYEERREWVRNANKSLLVKLLPFLDTLTMASLHSTDESLQVTLAQFRKILRDEGVIHIETQGKEFDPANMECIQTVPGEEGKVAKEVRAGYRLYDMILRPAQVVVGKEELKHE